MSGPADLPEHLDAVTRLLERRPAGLFVDIDGTLSPINPDPGAVTTTPRVRSALATLASKMTVVVLTGREVAAARRIVGLDSVTYSGNHGAEWLEDGRTSVLPEAQQYVARMHELAGRIARELSKVQGLLLQDKGPTLSVHYRRSPDPAAAQNTVLEFLRGAEEAAGLIIGQGKMVVEVLPPIPITKGTALRSVVARRGLRAAMVIGDDTTDVLAFHAVAELRDETDFDGLAVAVLGGSPPAELLAGADYALANTDAVERFLTWLADSQAKDV